MPSGQLHSVRRGPGRDRAACRNGRAGGTRRTSSATPAPRTCSKGGADIRHIQQLLSHASLDSTAIYTRVLPVDLAKAIETAHPREKNWRPKKSRVE